MEWFIILLFAGGAVLVHRHYSRRHREKSAEPKPMDLALRDTVAETPSAGIDSDPALARLEREIQLRVEAPMEPPSPAGPSHSSSIDQARPAAAVVPEIPDPMPLRQWREAAGLTGGTLALASGLKSSVVHQIENGTRSPTEREAFALSNTLGIPTDRITFPVRSILGSIGESRRDFLGERAVRNLAAISSSNRPVAPFEGREGANGGPGASSEGSPSSAHASSRLQDRIVAGPLPVGRARELRGLSIKQLSDRTRIAVATVYQIETRARTPTPDELEMLSKVLNIDASLLLVQPQPQPAPVPSAPAPSIAPTAEAAPVQAASSVGERISRFAESVRQSRLPYRWVGSGEVLEIAGHTIRGGLFFVGRELHAPRSGRRDPSLVDPSARVAASGADIAGSSVPYWPSYSEISPAARLAHLQWLAGGRNDPDYGICYPFIFLYGLERRLFHDGEASDAAAIVAEVERLLAIYGRDYSFRTYASKLLGAAAGLLDDVPKPTPSPTLWTGEDLPVAIRLHLGRRIAEGATLDADDALVWLLGHPETRTRTAIERCFQEARLLWGARFAERFPSGMKVTAPKRTMLVRYGAASGEFEAEIVPSFRGRPVPDVVGLSAPLKWMREALDACSEELQPYSRLLGRKPEARGTIEAAFLVPKAIANTEFGAPARAVGDALRARLTASGMAAIPVRTLMSSLGMPDPAEGRIPAATATQLGAILDCLDLGMEPDRRYGSGTPGSDGDVILFSAPGGGDVDADRDEYKAMRTMIEVAVLAAASDDSKDPTEIAAIEVDIAASAGLGAAERARLQAFARHLMSAGTKQGSVLSRLAKMPDLDRKRVARSAMSAVLADGHASPAEIRFLEKLYKTMGLPVDDLYSAIHRGAIEVDAPVSIAPEEVAVGVAIPRLPSADASVAAPAPGVRVDQARLDRIRSETSAVSQLLADIFEEDFADPAPVVRQDAASVSEADGLGGLDAAHAGLLRTVEARGSVDRFEFDKLARDFGLLPDGAIETINEWAFDRFDESILDEVDEGISIPDHLRAALNDASEKA